MSIVVHKRFLDSNIHDDELTDAQYNRRKVLYSQLDDIEDPFGVVQVGVSAQHQWDTKQSKWVNGECLWVAAMGDFDESTLVLPDTVTVQVNLFKHDDNHRLAAPQAK